MGHLWILDGKWSLLSDFVPAPPREQSDIITPLTLSNGLETRLRCLVRFQLGLRRQEQEKKTASKDREFSYLSFVLITSTVLVIRNCRA